MIPWVTDLPPWKTNGSPYGRRKRRVLRLWKTWKSAAGNTLKVTASCLRLPRTWQSVSYTFVPVNSFQPFQYQYNQIVSLPNGLPFGFHRASSEAKGLSQCCLQRPGAVIWPAIERSAMQSRRSAAATGGRVEIWGLAGLLTTGPLTQRFYFSAPGFQDRLAASRGSVGRCGAMGRGAGVRRGSRHRLALCGRDRAMSRGAYGNFGHSKSTIRRDRLIAGRFV